MAAHKVRVGLLQVEKLVALQAPITVFNFVAVQGLMDLVIAHDYQPHVHPLPHCHEHFCHRQVVLHLLLIEC